MNTGSIIPNKNDKTRPKILNPRNRPKIPRIILIIFLDLSKIITKYIFFFYQYLIQGIDYQKWYAYRYYYINGNTQYF